VLAHFKGAAYALGVGSRAVFVRLIQEFRVNADFRQNFFDIDFVVAGVGLVAAPGSAPS
jgi:hypothetical protein